MTSFSILTEYNQSLADNISYFVSQKKWIIMHKHWTQFESISYGWHVALAGFALIASLVAFVGNLLVISLFVRYKTFRNSANILVFNLAISDVSLVLSNFPMLIASSFFGEWLFGIIGCRIYSFFGALSGFLSVNTLTAIAMERCIVIVFRLPWHGKTSAKSVIFAIVFVWLYSLSWAIAPLFGWGDYILEGTLTSCTFDFFTRSENNTSFVISILICCFFIQLGIICISYLTIFFKVARHERKFKYMSVHLNRSFFSLRASRDRKNQKCEIKTAKVALCIIIVFCASWFPYVIVCIIGMFGKKELIFPLTSAIPGLCAKTATCLNPVIYALLHPKFRCKLSKLCFRKRLRCCSRKNESDTNSKGSDLVMRELAKGSKQSNSFITDIENVSMKT